MAVRSARIDPFSRLQNQDGHTRYDILGCEDALGLIKLTEIFFYIYSRIWDILHVFFIPVAVYLTFNLYVLADLRTGMARANRSGDNGTIRG